MKYQHLVTYALLILLFAACHQPRPDNLITSIELARTGAADYGKALRIDSSLNFQYFDPYKNPPNQYYTGRVSKEFWNTLNSKLKQVDYKTVKPKSEGMIIDDTAFEVIFSGKGGYKRRVSGRWSDHSTLERLLKWMADSVTNLPMQKSTQPLLFETTLQKPPPKPKKNGVRFPLLHNRH